MENDITREFCRIFKDIEKSPEILNMAIKAILSEATLWEIAWALKSIDKVTLRIIENSIEPKIFQDIKLMMRYIGPVRLKDVEELQNKLIYILKTNNIKGLDNIYVDESIEISKPYSLNITVEEIKKMIENGELDY